MTKCSPIVSTCDSILKSSLWIPMLYLLFSCSRTSELYSGILVTFLLISETSLSKIILICCSFDRKTSSLRSACFLTSRSFYKSYQSTFTYLNTLDEIRDIWVCEIKGLFLWNQVIESSARFHETDFTFES